MEPKGDRLYMLDVGDEILLMEEFNIDIHASRYNKAGDLLLERFNMLQDALFDHDGKPCYVGAPGRADKKVRLTLPVGTYLRVDGLEAWKRCAGRGRVKFVISGVTEETRTKHSIKSRRDCKNMGSFWIPIRQVNGLRFLPATEPDEEDSVE